jgi:serine/threonine-protein kinase SRPK3
MIYTGKRSEIAYKKSYLQFEDIQAGNIMVQIPDESLITRYLESISTETKASPTLDSATTHVIPSEGLRDFYFPHDGFDMMTLDISLSDWGVASWVDNHLTELIQPVLLRAPEVILETGWVPAVDDWNLGVLVPELLYAQNMLRR